MSIKSKTTKVQEIIEDDEQFRAILAKANQNLAMLCAAKEEQLESRRALHKAAGSTQTMREIHQLQEEIAALYEKAEQAVIEYVGNQAKLRANTKLLAESGIEGIQPIDEFSDEFGDTAFSLALLEVDEKLQSDCVRIAAEVTNGNVSPLVIARETGLPIRRIVQLLQNGEFKRRIVQFHEQLDGSATDESRILRETLVQLNQIQMERALSATPSDLFSDEDFAMVGLNPLMRDPKLQATPGGSTGLYKLEVVTTRKVVGGQSRMVSEVVPVLDTDLIRMKMDIGKRLTELQDAGKGGKSSGTNVYVRRREIDREE